MDAQGKANFFAGTFAGKSKLPPLCRKLLHRAPPKPRASGGRRLPDSGAMHGCACWSLRRQLHFSDLVPARILKRCARQAGQADAVPAAAHDGDSFMACTLGGTHQQKEGRFLCQQLQRPYTRLPNCRRLPRVCCSLWLSRTSVAQLLVDQTSSPTPEAVERGSRWLTSRCRGSLRSIAA